MDNKIIRNDDKCRVCAGSKIQTVLRLKDTPLEDQYVDEAHKDVLQPVYPLELAICEDCGYVYLPHIVSPEVSYTDYLYTSSVTTGLRTHYDGYAKDIIDKYDISTGSLVVDLGSNDGSMLESFKRQGMSVVGVEPAGSIATYANSQVLTTINDYFTSDTVSRILADHGAVRCVTANYMFANVDDIVSFTKSVASLLTNDGIFIVQTGYHPEQFKINMFDYIYHEHFSYFTVEVLSTLYKKCGLEIIDVQKTKPKGGSVRVVAQLCKSNRKVDKSVQNTIEEEKKAGVRDLVTYERFSDSLLSIKEELKSLLSSLKLKGKRIVGLGASHSTTTLLYHFELDDFIEYIVDDNEMKHGLYSPGYHIPVFPTDRINTDKPDYVLILAWQHQGTILERHSSFVETGGKFIIPLPSIKIIE